MKIITFTEQELEDLISLINMEFDQEYQFQIDGDHNPEWLIKYLNVYKKIVYARYNKGMETLVAQAMISKKEDLIKEIQDENNN